MSEFDAPKKLKVMSKKLDINKLQPPKTIFRAGREYMVDTGEEVVRPNSKAEDEGLSGTASIGVSRKPKPVPIPPEKPKEPTHEQQKKILELRVIYGFTQGKRIKQLCKPMGLSIKQVEDVLRSGIKRRMRSDPVPEMYQTPLLKSNKED